MANLKTFGFENQEIKDMENLLDNSDLPDAGRVHLHNALGLEYESRKNYDKAFQNLSACNALRRKSESYDPVEYETMIDKIIEILSLKKLRNKPAKSADVTPIFIVGLPRSGSTLVEAIITSSENNIPSFGESAFINMGVINQLSTKILLTFIFIIYNHPKRYIHT